MSGTLLGRIGDSLLGRIEDPPLGRIGDALLGTVDGEPACRGVTVEAVDGEV